MPNTGLSADTQALMTFESNKKSAGLAYLLWFFTGGVGGHRFYLGRTGSAIGQLVLSLLGWILILAAGIGLLLLIPLGIWLVVDLFLIPGMVRGHNTHLMHQLNNAQTIAPGNPADELSKYASLRDQGAISEEEYATKKAKLLS